MEINVAEILKQISCSWELISLKGNDREYKDKNVIAISGRSGGVWFHIVKHLFLKYQFRILLKWNYYFYYYTNLKFLLLVPGRKVIKSYGNFFRLA